MTTAVKLITITLIVLFSTSFIIMSFSGNGKNDYDATTTRWIRITKTYSDFSAASLNNTIVIYSLPAKAIIHDVIIKHNTSFSGGGINHYTVSAGYTGQDQFYINNSNVFISPAPTLYYSMASPIVGVPFSSSSGTNIVSSAHSTGANLNAATGGAVDFYIQISMIQ